MGARRGRPGRVFHHTPPLLRPARDLFFDHTPFLQKVVGDTNPSEINKQLALIEDLGEAAARYPLSGI